MKFGQSFTARFLPYFMAALMVVIFVIGLIVFSWILIIAAILGGILFLIATIRRKIDERKKRKQNRIIEHDTQR